ncbi:MAG: PBP1A family penicillin-binding protein [Oscillospiraceae bacterium]|nr:PBP1A family penicillin-binding protein [Oscillospiraceae bacterium]
MDTVKTKRVAKKIIKTGFWIVSDLFFLGLKIVGTLVLIAIATCVIFASFFIDYVKNDIAVNLEVNPADFSLSRSSRIVTIDPNSGRQIELSTILSTEFRRWVDYKELPEHLINAVVAIEDHRFFSHSGVDWYRTFGAFMNMFLGMRDTFGGSTITQQLIKNLTNEDDITVQRKLQEIFRALEYERHFSKEEVLELYLNLVYFGNSCYGIGAAAHFYFNKEVSELTLPEAAAIISITNNPSLYSPYADRQANKERQETVLWRMYDLGYIKTEQEYRQALRATLHFQRGVDESSTEVIYSYFEEVVMRDAINEMMMQLGVSEQVARRYLNSGGLTIVATINPEMQAIVDNIYRYPEKLPEVTGSNQQLQSGIIVADPYTGEILALSGGVGFKTRNLPLNRATQTRRPPGSAIKPLSAYAPALDLGLLTPDTTYNDDKDAVLSGTEWMPRNVTRDWYGVVTVRQALRASINTVAAMVVDQLTPTTSFLFMRDILGFALDPADEDYAPLAAGQLTWGATVREMASAYTMFPNAGKRVELRSFSMIYDYNGDVLLDNRVSRSIDAISDVSAYWMTDMLVDAVTSGTGGSASLSASMPVAGKTGTSSDNKDRWFVGYTPYYLAAVWTGYDTPLEMKSSGNPAAQIWRMIMGPIHENLESRAFSMPINVELPTVSSPWELIKSSYTVRCVDTEGEILHEITEESTVGAEVMADAPDIPEYTLLGQSFAAVEISADPSRNIITFVYESDIPEETPPPDDILPPDGLPPDGLPPDGLPPDGLPPDDTPPPEPPLP